MTADRNDPTEDHASEKSPASDESPASDDESVRFGAALDELQQLVAELESDRLDVDQLTRRVERATELVVWCRERLDATRFQVEELLVRLDDVAEAARDADDDPTSS